MMSDPTLQDIFFGLAMVWIVLIFYAFYFNR